MPNTEHPAVSKSPPRPTEVLIAEPREMAANAMVQAINRARGLHVSARCLTCSALAAACAAAPPDVAVIDIGLYRNDPSAAVLSVREHAALAKILLLTAAIDPEGMARAFLAGAQNCISECVDHLTFVHAIRATALGGSLLEPQLERNVALLMLEIEHADGHRLSTREIEVLRLASNGLAVADIATRLFISPNTTRTHLRRSYRKLGTVNRSGAVAIAMRQGLLQ